VRRIIRNVNSREYFQWGQWTPDASRAQHFPDSGKVIEACLKHHLRDVELVLQPDAEGAAAFETHFRLFEDMPPSETALRNRTAAAA
jgi:hypothetical protein